MMAGFGGVPELEERELGRREGFVESPGENFVPLVHFGPLFPVNFFVVDSDLDFEELVFREQSDEVELVLADF